MSKSFLHSGLVALLLLGCNAASGQEQSPPHTQESIHQIETQINDLILKGDKQRAEQKLREAQASYFDALELAHKSNRTELQARAQLKFANIVGLFGMYGWALEFVDETVPLINEQQFPDLLAEAMVSRGIYATKLNKYEIALAANLRAIEIAQKHHNIVAMAEASIDLLPSLIWYGRLDDAEAYGSVGLQLCGAIKGSDSCFRDALDGLSEAYGSRKDYDRSCATGLAAMGFGKKNSGSFPISYEETLMMRCLRSEGLLDVSISLGLDAVNMDQDRRTLVSDHSPEIRSSFAWGAAYTYKELADALFEQNQVDQGEYVLDLLKAMSIYSVSPAADSELKTLPVSALDKQRLRQVLASADAAASSIKIRDIGSPPQWERLGFTSPEKDLLRKQLNDILNRASELDRLMPALTATEKLGAAHRDLPHSSISEIVKTSGPGVMALCTLTLWDHTEVALTTKDGVKYVRLKRSGNDVGQLELIKLMAEPLEAVRDSARDPWDGLHQLYTIIIGSLNVDIKAVSAKSPDSIPTLIWSLDGILRFLPINALFDGKQFFVEQARNIFINPDEKGYSSGTPKIRSFRILAGGKTQFGGTSGLQDLDEVALELKSIARDPAVSDSHGPIAGRILLDDSFTLPALVQGLKEKPAIVHLATHFIHQIGNDTVSDDSYLVLTDSTDVKKTRGLSMADFEDSQDLDLSSVELLTLSACSTGESNETSSLQDVDSFAVILRRRGAAAVLAPLWKTDDAASRLFMSSFYTLWSAHPGLGKLEALRQTQLKMLNGMIGRKQKRLPALMTSPDPHEGFYAHPFYWATYQLNGDFH